MDLGGNEAWRGFWEGETGKEWGRPGEGGDAGAGRVVGERYGGGVGEEWKERLGCLVDGREFCGVVRRGEEAATIDVRKGGSMEGGGGRSRKEINEDFFARKGGENGERPEGVAPSLGGKYAGFGSEPVASPPGAGGGGGGGVEAFQADPVGALTKGFWGFAGAVGKGAKTLNEGYIQPTAQKVLFLLSFLLIYPTLRTEWHVLIHIPPIHPDRRSRPSNPSPPHSRASRQDHPNGHQRRGGEIQQFCGECW